MKRLAPLVTALRARRTWPLLLAAALATGPGIAPLAQAQSAAAAKQRGDHIVAVVNSELVTAFEVAQRAEQLMAEARSRGGAVPGDLQARQQALELLINERVQVTYARESGYRVDEVELDRAVGAVAAQNRLTAPQLRERLKEQGVDYGRFRKNLRDQLMLERVREREVISRIQVSDADIDRELAARQAQSGGEPELNLAQILVKVPEGAGAAELAERKARAEAALARVQGGEDFAAVARAVSEDGNAATGGEIGQRPASRLPDLFVAAVAALKPGEVTPEVLRSGAGFHVLKLLAREQASAFTVAQTRVRHVLLRVPDGTPADQVAARMAALRQEITGGQRSFEAVARAVSEDGSAPQGGDLGWVGPGQFVPEFEQAMDQLEPGQISAPVTSRFGIHLIQVLERRQAEVDGKALREQVMNQLRERRFELEYADWVKELRLRSYVEMREPPL